MPLLLPNIIVIRLSTETAMFAIAGGEPSANETLLVDH